MSECQHKKCCGCERPAVVAVEVLGTDGVSRYELCERHHLMVLDEARRKGVKVISE